MLLALGCGGALSETEVGERRTDARARTGASLKRAREAALKTNHLSVRAEQQASVQIDSMAMYADPPGPGTPRVVDVVAKPPSQGLVGGERLVRIAESDDGPSRLALLMPSCHDGNSCSCTEPFGHLIATDANGKDVVLRLRPEHKSERVHQKGMCGYGCGQPSPPQPPAVYWLSGSPAEARFIDVSYTAYSVDVSCDKMVGRP